MTDEQENVFILVPAGAGSSLIANLLGRYMSYGGDEWDRVDSPHFPPSWLSGKLFNYEPNVFQHIRKAKYNWPGILSRLDETNPAKGRRVFKSINDLYRFDYIKENVPNAKFVCVARDAFAYIAGRMRRSMENVNNSIDNASRAFLNVVDWQVKAVETLGEDILYFSYEDLCACRPQTIEDIRRFFRVPFNIDLTYEFQHPNDVAPIPLWKGLQRNKDYFYKMKEEHRMFVLERVCSNENVKSWEFYFNQRVLL